MSECRQHIDNEFYSRIRCSHLDNRFVVEIHSIRSDAYFIDYVQESDDYDGFICQSHYWFPDLDMVLSRDEIYELLVSKMLRGEPPEDSYHACDQELDV